MQTTSMVARVALIVNLFDDPGRRLRLDQVVARTGLPRSSVHRILRQLQEAGLLQHRPDGYCIAASPLPVARMVDHAELRGVAAPLLTRLHADTGLVVTLGLLLGGDVVCLDQAGGDGVPVPTRVAGRTPAHASALGKAMLAGLPAEELDAVLTDPLPRRTRATIGDLATLHRELAGIRGRHGLAYDTEELAVGLCSVAAPIRTGAGEIAGLALTGATGLAGLQRTAPFVLRAAGRISDRLGRTDFDVALDPVGAADTDSMLSRVLRTISSDAWV